jgi:hypothetical protein
VPTGYTPVKGAESLAEHNKEVLDLFDRMVVALTPVFKIVAGGVGLVRGLVGDVWGLVGLARGLIRGLVGLARRLIRLARRLVRLVRGLVGDARRFVGQGSLVLSGRCLHSKITRSFLDASNMSDVLIAPSAQAHQERSSLSVLRSDPQNVSNGVSALQGGSDSF